MSSYQHLFDSLIHIYDYEESELKNKSKKELEEILLQEEQKHIQKHKNPNHFFVLNDLPAPKEVKTKTSKKAGILVIIAFLAVFLIFGILMFWWAFR